MKALIFDIETGANDKAKSFIAPFDEKNPDHVKYGNTKDPDKRADIAKQSAAIYYDKAKSLYPLSAVTGRVLTIGYGDADSELVTVEKLEAGVTEKMLLENFWNTVGTVEGEGGIIVGYNIKKFDLPFLVKRSWILGVTPYPMMEGRWWKEFVTDLYEIWTLWGGSELYPYLSAKLSSVCNILGLGHKDDNIGKNFEKYFFEDQDKALGYAIGDIVKTRKLYHIVKDFIRFKKGGFLDETNQLLQN